MNWFNKNLTIILCISHFPPFVPLQLTVIARDGAWEPKLATATVTISIVRNQFTPQFARDAFSASISSAYSIGRSLFVASAVDGDRDVPVSSQTPNAEIVYSIVAINNDNPQTYFAVDQNGLVYVRRSPLESAGTRTFEVGSFHNEEICIIV